MYRQTLERELADLRRRRVQLRQRLDWFAKGHRLGDEIDTRKLVEGIRMELRATDRPYYDLALKLGRKDLIDVKPVSLKISAVERAALSRQRAKATPRRVPNYVTKVMVPGC